MIKNIIIGILAASTLFFAWIALTINNNPLQIIYREYNHIKVYEDGSWVGETKDGIRASGCIVKAPCKD